MNGLGLLLPLGNSECGVTDMEPIRLEVDFDVSRDVLMLNI